MLDLWFQCSMQRLSYAAQDEGDGLRLDKSFQAQKSLPGVDFSIILPSFL